MQVFVRCLIFFAVEYIQLVQNERLDSQEVLDSTQFKNAVAKELLTKKLSTLEAARQKDSLAVFLRKGSKNLSGLRTAPKSSFHKDDDPSRKQAQMANTFIASSNLLFGTKSQQKKACNAGKQTNKEILDMRSLRQTYSGYNEDGNDFSASKEATKSSVNDSLTSALQKRSNPKYSQDPISCYLTEPKRVTCMHKDIIYKIALPSSEVADDEIGRIVESIYRAVEGNSKGKASLEESVEDAASQKISLKGSAEVADSKKTADDSSKKKRASEDYLRYLNSLLVANHRTLPNYNGNPVFIPLLIPMSQPKLDVTKTQAAYYPGLPTDPRLQVPMNLTVGVDPVNHYQAGRNLMDVYGQYLVPDGLPLPELNLKQRSQINLTAEEEKRRNWLALMATNGLVPVENGVNPKVLTHSNGEVQSIAEEKDSTGGSKQTVAETEEASDKVLNKRQERDTYFIRRQMRRKPMFEDKPTLTSFNEQGRKHMLTKVVQKLSDPGGNVWDEKRGCPCPCPCPSDLCATGSTSKNPRKPTKCAPKNPLKLSFLQTSQPPKEDECGCASTTKCATTTCPPRSMCPEGCQPISPSACKPCPKKYDRCGDSDILSKVVAGSMKTSSDIQRGALNPLPPVVHTAPQNWLPYSPQWIPHNQPQLTGQSHESGHAEASQNYQDQQQYFASGSGVRIQYSSNVNRKPPKPSEILKDDLLEERSSDQADHPMPQQQDSGIFQQHSPGTSNLQPQEEPQQNFPPQNPIINRIQVYHNLPPSSPRSSSDSARAAGSSDIQEVGSKTNDVRYKLNQPLEHENATSKQTEAKSKKHHDSFFARLRSKFHKGILLNGTEQDTQSSNQNQQNKVIVGTSVFKFSPKNLTWGRNGSTTIQPMNNQQCPEDYNDRTVTFANQSQPSTVNNINITITSQTHPNSLIRMNNHTNQLPHRSNLQCPGRMSTARNGNGPNQTRKVTKIWMCSKPTNSTAMNETCTQPSTYQANLTATTQCTTNSTTTSPTTQSTCQTSTTPSTCTTSPPTCQITTSPPTTGSTCGNGNTSLDIEPTNSTASSGGADTPTTCGSDITPGYSPPQSDNPWSPMDSQLPPGMPSPPPDTAQGNPGTRWRTFQNYGPYPVWNQWQYPMDRMNPRPPEQNLNWQQQTGVPQLTPFVPQPPQQKPPEQNPRPPVPTTFAHVPHQKQADPVPPRQQWHPNQPQMWPAHSRQVELDSRWQNQPSYPVQDPIKGHFRPSGAEPHYRPPMNTSANDNKKWSGQLPANIKQHIARVRRYLLKKRSKTSTQESAKKSIQTLKS